MIPDKLLAKGQSKVQMRALVEFIGGNPQRFSDLLTHALTGPANHSILATWSMSYCVELHPELINKHYPRLLAAASEKKASDSIKRSVVRALQFVNIPARYQGKVVDLCVGFLANKKEAIAIRVFSMSVLANLALENPGLTEELILLIEDGMSYATPAYLSRSKKVLKQLKSLPLTHKD